MPPSTPAPALENIEPTEIPAVPAMPGYFEEGMDATGVRLIGSDTIPSGPDTIPASCRPGDTLPSRDTFPAGDEDEHAVNADDTDRVSCETVVAEVKALTLHELALTTASLPTDRPDPDAAPVPLDGVEDASAFIEALLNEGDDAVPNFSRPAPKRSPSGELHIDLNRPDLEDWDENDKK